MEGGRRGTNPNKNLRRLNYTGHFKTIGGNETVGGKKKKNACNNALNANEIGWTQGRKKGFIQGPKLQKTQVNRERIFS